MKPVNSVKTEEKLEDKKRTRLDGVLVEVDDAVLAKDVLVDAEAAGEGARISRQDGVGRVGHDARPAQVLGGLFAAQHVHGRRRDSCR